MRTSPPEGQATHGVVNGPPPAMSEPETEMAKQLMDCVLAKQLMDCVLGRSELDRQTFAKLEQLFEDHIEFRQGLINLREVARRLQSTDDLLQIADHVEKDLDV